MYQILDFREIFLTFASLDCTNGYTIMTVVLSPKINERLEECLVPSRMKGMKWRKLCWMQKQGLFLLVIFVNLAKMKYSLKLIKSLPGGEKKARFTSYLLQYVNFSGGLVESLIIIPPKVDYTVLWTIWTISSNYLRCIRQSCGLVEPLFLTTSLLRVERLCLFCQCDQLFPQ